MAVTVKQFAMNHTICPFETNKAASAGGVDQIHWRRRQGPRERGAGARGRGHLPYALSKASQALLPRFAVPRPLFFFVPRTTWPRCRPQDNAPNIFFPPNSAHETERLQSSDTIELKSMVSRLAVVTPVNRQDNEALVRVPRASQEHHSLHTGASHKHTRASQALLSRL